MLDNTEFTERVEVLMTPAMKAWIKPAARRQGQKGASDLLRMLTARHLTETYGPGWSDGEEYEDHPQGDHGEDPLVPGQLIEMTQ